MLAANEKRKPCQAAARIIVAAIAGMVVAAGTSQAQVPPLPIPQGTLGNTANPFAGFGYAPVLAAPVFSADAADYDGAALSSEQRSVRPPGVRRITLEQVKQQQQADRLANPIARLNQFSVEAAKQHRLGVQADYFPKLSATAMNIHYSDFLGQVFTLRRPLLGSQAQVAVPLFSQDQTLAALMFVQPITPILQVRQVVRIARADERIAMAKAAASVAKNSRNTNVEETYFRLLIAQRRLISAESKLRSTGNRPLYASTAVDLVSTPVPQLELVEAQESVVRATAEVRELTASLNRVMGWPEDTELELALPDPLVENVSIQQVANKPTAANPEIVEAEQTVVKARAASTLSKLAYVPTVAAVGGYLFQNVIPLVPSNFGYGGVMASYNLFDFGKRERAVKEARAQLGMAEVGLELTKMKVASNVKKSYYDLERSRQLSLVAQKMGSSMARLMNVSAVPESKEAKAARAEVEIEMLEADLAHRQAMAHLEALTGPLQ